MPKLKTHKGTSKRIWKTGSGKLRRRKAGRDHFRGHKSAKQRLGRGVSVSMPAQNPRVGELLPY
ncbi:50S ribosomal protein L35 [bacterium]|nr:MAG: 50S ribosomal protein L35 [bacterium]